jgi:acyl-CoA synthetase (AMP-forming)/AMP-acid ligase II
VAVVHSVSSRSFTYGSLIADIARAKDELAQKAAKAQGQLAGERVAFLAENSYDYVGTVALNPLEKISRILIDL